MNDEAILLPATGQTLEVQLLLLLSKVIAKLDTVRDHLNAHIAGEHREQELFRSTLTASITRIEARLSQGSEAFRELEVRIDRVENDISWVRGGKAMLVAVASVILSLGACLGWVASTFHLTGGKP